MITDVELVSSVRDIRRLVSTLDSIGFQILDFNDDVELQTLIPNQLQNNLKNIAKDIHNMVQTMEKSERYKTAIKKCYKRQDD